MTFLFDWYTVRASGLSSQAIGTRKLNEFMRGIWTEDVFIPASKGLVLSECLIDFVRIYAWEAYEADQEDRQVFPMLPKLHALHEVGYEMKRQSLQSAWCFNPVVETCQLCEDFVGRTAYLTRCVSPRLQALRTLQRYLSQIHRAWGDARVG